MIGPEPEALIRRCAAGEINWRELRERGFEDYLEVLGALGELGLRAEQGRNVERPKI